MMVCWCGLESPPRLVTTVNTMKKKYIIILSLISGILISIPIYGLVGLPNIFNVFLSIDWKWALPYLGAVAVIYSSVVYRWKIIIEAGKIRVSFRKLFLYKLGGYAISYITPSAHMGGEPIRAVLLQQEGIPAKQGLATILIDKSIEIATDIVLGCVGFIVMLSMFSITSNSYYFFIALVAVGLSLIVTFYYRMLKGEYFFTPFFKILRLDKINSLKKSAIDLKNIEDNMLAFFKNHRKSFVYAALLHFGCWFIMFFEYKFLFLMLGVNLPFIHIFLVIAAIGIAYTTPVPAGLGTMEAGNIGALSFSGTKGSVGLAVSLLVRAKDLLLTTIGLLYLTYAGFTWKKINKIKTIEY